MKVKRYVGETAQEALHKVKSDLGRDAIILNTRKIKKPGLLGFFSKPLVEVVATIDSDGAPSSKYPKNSSFAPHAQPAVNKRPDVSPAYAARLYEAPDEMNHEGNSFKNELNATLNKQKENMVKKQEQTSMFSDELFHERPTLEKSKNRALEAEGLNHTKRLNEHTGTLERHNEHTGTLERLNERAGTVDMSEIKTMLNKVYDAVKVDYENVKLSDHVKNYLKRMEDGEIDRGIIEEIKEAIIEQLTFEKQQDESSVRDAIADILSQYIVEPEPFSFEQNKKVIIFIGPTGVGKTTTLAKLAANMVLVEKKKIGLVTSDTFRIAAVEQLKTYSEIIGVPLSIIYSPSEIFNAIQEYKDKDLVLVDTAGRSHKDKYQLMELKSLIKTSMDYEVYLVISATTKYSDCLEIIKSYSFLDNYKLLFTKMDETSSYGAILNVSYVTKQPISYMTAGQSVPDDIEIADKRKIIDCILGEKMYERSS